MGKITLESYNDQYLCIRMRWVDPDTKEGKIATFTHLAWQEGDDPRWAGIMLWSKANLAKAQHAYELVCKRALEIGDTELGGN